MRLGEYLASCIAAKGLTRRAFARQVAYPPGNLHQCIHGLRPVPEEHLKRWIRALGPAVDPELLRELWLLESCPSEIRDRYLAMKKRLAGKG